MMLAETPRGSFQTALSNPSTVSDIIDFTTPVSSFSSLPNSAAGASTGRAGTAGKKAARPKRVCKTVLQIVAHDLPILNEALCCSLT